MIRIRKSEDRGYADRGWLKGHYSFSFADYQDAAYMNFSTLRVLNDDRIAGGKGFGPHAHRDMEIITYVLEGHLLHRDSMGEQHVLGQNEVQTMSAGSGIVHSEFNASHTEAVHFLQIWLQPAVHGLKPSYQQLSLSEEQKLGKLLLVASPEGGGPLKIHQDARVLIGQVKAGQELAHDLPAGRQAWVHVIRGAANRRKRPCFSAGAKAIC